MNTKSILRTMMLLAAAGGAVSFLLPFVRREPPVAPAGRGRPRGSAVRPKTSGKAKAAEGASPGASKSRARRASHEKSNGGSPSHH